MRAYYSSGVSYNASCLDDNHKEYLQFNVGKLLLLCFT